MQDRPSNKLLIALKLAVAVLIMKVTVGVTSNYPDYLPPDFHSDFLQGREAYFRGPYQWAFYAHIIAGPLTLVLGLVLLSERFRRRFLHWHRLIGRIQVAVVLGLLTPSGLWMAFYAQTGAIAGAGFAVLSLATAFCVGRGWRLILNRRVAEHRRWMTRCFLLLCSAIVLRLIAGAFTVAQVDGDWTYPFAAWAGWLGPLLVFELLESRNRRHVRRSITSEAV